MVAGIDILFWGLLVGYCVLTVAALVVGARPQSRPIAFAVGLLAAPHAVYYALFLIWPDALGPQGTMLFSIALRYQVLFIGALLLAVWVTRRVWSRYRR